MVVVLAVSLSQAHDYFPNVPLSDHRVIWNRRDLYRLRGEIPANAVLVLPGAEDLQRDCEMYFGDRFRYVWLKEQR
jgi:hypothetical protein